MGKVGLLQGYIDIFARDMTALGGMFFYGLVVAFTLLIGKTTVALELVAALVITMGASLIIRALFFKQRPKKQTYNSALEKLDAASFPSIHAARITSLSIIIGRSLPHAYLWLLLSLTTIIVCWSRVYLKRHDIVDVSAGVIIGAIVSNAVLVVIP